MINNQSFATDNVGLPAGLTRDLHNFITNHTQETQEKINEKVEEIKHFSEVQSELTEFRLFLSIHADEKELKKISDEVRKDRDKLWKDLLRKNKGDEEKARDFFYE